MSTRSGWLIELFKSFISIMTFSTFLLPSVTKSGVLTALTIFEDLSIFPYSYVNFCFMYFVAVIK